MLSKRSLALSLLLAGTLVLASAARADWLVGKDGSRVETKGPWTVKGSTVVFTMPNGTLASLKLATLDLDASARVTAEAAEQAAQAAAPPAPAPAAEKRTAVLVLTDKDVGHVNPQTGEVVAEGGKEGEPAGEAAAAAPAPGGDVVVTAWDKSYSDTQGGIIIKGTVRNRGKHPALGVGVTVKVYDAEGKLAGEAPANLSAEALKPGQAANFSAVLPGVNVFTAAKLDVTSTPILSRQEGEPMESENPPPQP